MSIIRPLFKWQMLIILLLCSTCIPVLTIADEASPVINSGNTIFDGSIPSGEGKVPIKAASGKLYQISAMTPLGVIQALAGTDIIESYKVGDELISKMGILTLDGVNKIINTGDNSWFVYVNNIHLEDYLLPSQNALNLYKLQNGDVVLFAYGNPTLPPDEALKTMKVTIGTQTNGLIFQSSPVTSAHTTDMTLQPTVMPTVSIEPEETAPEVANIPVDSVETEKDPNLPVFEDEEKTLTNQKSQNQESGRDPNLPVYEDEEETLTNQKTQNQESDRDPNLPVFEDEEETLTDQKTQNQKSDKDPNLPVYEGKENDDQDESIDRVTMEESAKESDNIEEDTEEKETSTIVEEIPDSTIPASKKSSQNVLYEGKISLPTGSINLTTTSEIEYDIPANTPLGVLQKLMQDGKIQSLIADDKFFNKNGIIRLDAIDGYSYGEEAWFVQINKVTLKDYENSADGLNIRTFSSGDELTFYYGVLDQVPSTAKSVIYLTIN